ncbi:hypothetical protein LINGRAHAP2_LOCUS22580 [Linum grandiflorum]
MFLLLIFLEKATSLQISSPTMGIRFLLECTLFLAFKLILLIVFVMIWRVFPSLVRCTLECCLIFYKKNHNALLKFCLILGREIMFLL